MTDEIVFDGAKSDGDVSAAMRATLESGVPPDYCPRENYFQYPNLTLRNCYLPQELLDFQMPMKVLWLRNVRLRHPDDVRFLANIRAELLDFEITSPSCGLSPDVEWRLPEPFVRYLKRVEIKVFDQVSLDAILQPLTECSLDYLEIIMWSEVEHFTLTDSIMDRLESTDTGRRPLTAMLHVQGHLHSKQVTRLDRCMSSGTCIHNPWKPISVFGDNPNIRRYGWDTRWRTTRLDLPFFHARCANPTTTCEVRASRSISPDDIAECDAPVERLRVIKHQPRWLLTQRDVKLIAALPLRVLEVVSCLSHRQVRQEHRGGLQHKLYFDPKCAFNPRAAIWSTLQRFDLIMSGTQSLATFPVFLCDPNPAPPQLVQLTVHCGGDGIVSFPRTVLPCARQLTRLDLGPSVDIDMHTFSECIMGAMPSLRYLGLPMRAIQSGQLMRDDTLLDVSHWPPLWAMWINRWGGLDDDRYRAGAIPVGEDLLINVAPAILDWIEERCFASVDPMIVCETIETVMNVRRTIRSCAVRLQMNVGDAHYPQCLLDALDRRLPYKSAQLEALRQVLCRTMRDYSIADERMVKLYDIDAPMVVTNWIENMCIYFMHLMGDDSAMYMKLRYVLFGTILHD